MLVDGHLISTSIYLYVCVVGDTVKFWEIFHEEIMKWNLLTVFCRWSVPKPEQRRSSSTQEQSGTLPMRWCSCSTFQCSTSHTYKNILRMILPWNIIAILPLNSPIDAILYSGSDLPLVAGALRVVITGAVTVRSTRTDQRVHIHHNRLAVQHRVIVCQEFDFVVAMVAERHLQRDVIAACVGCEAFLECIVTLRQCFRIEQVRRRSDGDCDVSRCAVGEDDVDRVVCVQVADVKSTHVSTLCFVSFELQLDRICKIIFSYVP